MNSEYNPPINKRCTKDLLAIVENVEEWKDDALEQARRELESGGYTVSQQKRREQSKLAYRKRVNKIKANASFPPTLMAVQFLFSPFLLAARFGGIPFIDGGKTTLGNLFWILIFNLFY